MRKEEVSTRVISLFTCYVTLCYLHARRFHWYIKVISLSSPCSSHYFVWFFVYEHLSKTSTTNLADALLFSLYACLSAYLFYDKKLRRGNMNTKPEYKWCLHTWFFLFFFLLLLLLFSYSLMLSLTQFLLFSPAIHDTLNVLENDVPPKKMSFLHSTLLLSYSVSFSSIFGVQKSKKKKKVSISSFLCWLFFFTQTFYFPSSALSLRSVLNVDMIHV